MTGTLTGCPNGVKKAIELASATPNAKVRGLPCNCEGEIGYTSLTKVQWKGIYEQGDPTPQR
jgi:hypothetical protein